MCCWFQSDYHLGCGEILLNALSSILLFSPLILCMYDANLLSWFLPALLYLTFLSLPCLLSLGVLGLSFFFFFCLFVQRLVQCSL